MSSDRVPVAVPEAVGALRAAAAGAAAVRVSWLSPAATGRLTHYTLYTRELGKYVACLSVDSYRRHTLLITSD